MVLEKNNIYCGDCLELLKQIPDNSVDSIITDPPYGLEFMGKDWDKFGISEGRARRLQAIDSKGSGDRFFDYRDGVACRGRYSEMNNKEKSSFQNFIFEFSKEAIRVLKPGGHLLAFGGTRTYHRLTCAIEDAGFEIRDCIMWIYGSGFPKSLNIGKAVDKLCGNERKVVGISKDEKDFRDVGQKVKEIEGINKLSFGLIENAERKSLEITHGDSEWEGWGTALKPAVEPIVVARKPLSEKTVAENVLKWGTGGINIDESRVSINPEIDDSRLGGNGSWKTDKCAKNIYEGGFAGENIKSSNLGRFPANIIFECICDELIEGKAKGSQGHWSKSKTMGFGEFGNGKSEYFGVGEKDTMNCFIHTNPNCPCYILDNQAPSTGAYAPVKSGQKEWGGEIYHKFKSGGDDGKTFYQEGKRGGASRFFYCAKASKSERNYGCYELEQLKAFGYGSIRKSEGRTGINEPRHNSHPTVKPIKLMEYLCKLVTPKTGLILDPFMGSGTTGIASYNVGFNFIGIEREEQYFNIAKARINKSKEFFNENTNAS